MDVDGGEEVDPFKRLRDTSATESHEDMMDVEGDKKKPKFLEDWTEYHVFVHVKEWSIKKKSIIQNFPVSSEGFPKGVVVSMTLATGGDLAHQFASVLSEHQLGEFWTELQASFEYIPSKPLKGWSKYQVFDCVKSWNREKQLISELLPNEKYLPTGRNVANNLQDLQQFRIQFFGLGIQQDSFWSELRQLFLGISSSSGQTRKYVPKDPRSRVEVKENFLNTEFFGTEHRSLLEYCVECSDVFQKHPQRFFTCCFPLVQSSGFGKSRCLLELGRLVNSNGRLEGMPLTRLVYICLRRAGASGYPPRSVHSSEMLFEESSDSVDPGVCETEFAKRLLAIYEVCFGSSSDSDIDTNLNFQGNDQTWWGKVQQRIYRLGNRNTFSQDETEKDKLLILAIDEASMLHDMEITSGRSYFKALQSAAKMVAHDWKKNIVIVLCDTRMKVSMFLPSRAVDPSQRSEGGNVSARYFLHPYIPYESFDCLKVYDSESIGRPLVAECKSNPGFLGIKLMCAPSPDMSSPEGLFALFLAVTSVYLSPLSRVSDVLVGSHMAALLAVSDDHQAVCVTYASEPALARSALRWWFVEGHLVSRILPVVRDFLIRGAIVKGAAGEIASQGVCHTAKHFAGSSGQSIGGETKVSLFLTQLLPASVTDNSVLMKVIPTGHGEGLINFVQFVQLPPHQKNLDEKFLEDGWARSLAFSLPHGHRGADHIIPYKIGGEMHFIMIQVKNESRGETKSAANELIVKNVFDERPQVGPKCIRVLFELGATESASQESVVALDGLDDDTAHGAKVLMCRGLEYRCLDKMDGLRNAVQSLLKTETSVEEFVKAATAAKLNDKNLMPPVPDNQQMGKLRSKFQYI